MLLSYVQPKRQPKIGELVSYKVYSHKKKKIVLITGLILENKVVRNCRYFYSIQWFGDNLDGVMSIKETYEKEDKIKSYKMVFNNEQFLLDIIKH